MPEHFSFINADVCDPTLPLQLPLAEFDLIIAIDVLFHIIEDHRFAAALRSIRSMQPRAFICTGLFTQWIDRKNPAPWCRHRRMREHLELLSMSVVDVQPWRDNRIGIFMPPMQSSDRDWAENQAGFVVPRKKEEESPNEPRP